MKQGEAMPARTRAIPVWTPDQQVPCAAAPDMWVEDEGKGRGTYTSHEAKFAIEVCHTGCPVRMECLDAALTEERGQSGSFRSGIRGGLTPMQRVRLDPTIKVPPSKQRRRGQHND